MKFSVSKAIDTDLCDSTVVIHNAPVAVYFLSGSDLQHIPH